MSANQTFAKRTGANMNNVFAKAGYPCELDEYKAVVRGNTAKTLPPVYQPADWPAGIFASGNAAARSRPARAFQL